MADNGFKINKSANFNPQLSGTPANPVDGDFFYDGTAQSFAYYHDGAWAYIDSVGTVEAVEFMTGAQFTSTIVRNALVKITDNSSASYLQGMVSSHTGKTIKIYNGGTFNITVQHENAGEATTNNRIQTPTAGDMNLIPGEIATFTYDVVANRWLLVSISSGAGAQAIATTSSPGIVTLHQASLFPLDGIVLSDGDLDTANGVVGLNANRAVVIAAPLAAVTAVDITAAANASALVLNGGTGSTVLAQLNIGAGTGSFLEWRDGSSNLLGAVSNNGDVTLESGIKFAQNRAGGITTEFFVDDDDVQLGRRKLKFSNDDGSGNTYDNYMQYTYLGGTSRRGMIFVNETSAGAGAFVVEAVNDGSGGTRQELMLRASTGSDQYIVNEQGNLYINFLESDSTYVGCSAGGVIGFTANSTDLWQISGAGVLSALGGNRAIQNVLDPVNAQDAATKNYVDMRRSQNFIQNSDFYFNQRTGALGGYAFSDSKTPIIDRWLLKVGAVDTTGAVYQAAPTVAKPGTTRVLHAYRDEANTGEDRVVLAQEIDRGFVRSMAGRTLGLSWWSVAGADWSAGDVAVTLVTGTGSVTEVRLNTAGVTAAYTTGSQTDLSATYPPNIGTWQYHFIEVPAALRDEITTAEIRFYWTPSGTAGPEDWIEFSNIMLSENTAYAPWSLASGTRSEELSAIQHYYEKTYDVDHAVGSTASNAAYRQWHTFSYGNAYGAAGVPLILGFHPRFKCSKRVTPSITLWSDSGFSGSWRDPPFTGALRAVAPIETTLDNFRVASDDVFTTTSGAFGGHWVADADF